MCVCDITSKYTIVHSTFCENRVLLFNLPTCKAFEFRQTNSLRIGELWLQTPPSAPDTLWNLSIKGHYDNA